MTSADLEVTFNTPTVTTHNGDNKHVDKLHTSTGPTTTKMEPLATAKERRKRRRSSQPPPLATQVAAPVVRPSRAAIAPKLTWPFPVDYCDHFETSSTAVRDVAPFLSQIATSMGKSLSTLRIYDPFYCAGGIKAHLHELGFTTVINRCVDFYSDVANNAVPEYDVLLTNPPYSGDHKERCISFAMASGKPWALLLPTYVSTKKYYSSAINASDPPFYVVPRIAYEFSHPEGTGHDEPPFASMWFLHGGAPGSTAMLHDTLRSSAGSKSARIPCSSGSWSSSRYTDGAVTVVRTVAELAAVGSVTVSRRPNPRQRKKMRAIMAAKAAGTGSIGRLPK